MQSYRDNGYPIPDGFFIEDVKAQADYKAVFRTNQADAPITVRHVIEAYREHVKKRYVGSKSDLARYLKICLLDDLQGH